jgi:hypothetical protein
MMKLLLEILDVAEGRISCWSRGKLVSTALLMIGCLGLSGCRDLSVAGLEFVLEDEGQQ